MKKKITVAIVDDQELYRDGLIQVLKSDPRIKIITSMESGEKFIEFLKKTHLEPEVILLDINMPGMSGYETATNVHALLPESKILFLTTNKGQAFVKKATESSGSGYLEKESETDTLVEAIFAARDHEFSRNEFVTGKVNRPFMENSTKKDLTEREKGFIRLVCDEKSMEEIAQEMGITINTARTYRQRILNKIGAKKTAGIVSYAIKNKLF